MQKAKHKNKQGMTLIELMVSITILALVSAGCAASAILFAKIAHSHENVADFRKDLRYGFEQMAIDVRNASGVSSRTDTAFTITFTDSPNISYWFDATEGVVYRQEAGSNERAVINNVTVFDILHNASDVGSNEILTYDNDEISLEQLTLRAPNGSAPASSLSLSNLTLKLRNS